MVVIILMMLGGSDAWNIIESRDVNRLGMYKNVATTQPY